jgi:hypothetical protein
MNITDEQIKELKQLLWILDSKHNVSVPQTQENINHISDEIVKLFSIPDVSCFSAEKVEEAYRDGWEDRRIGTDTFHISNYS